MRRVIRSAIAVAAATLTLLILAPASHAVTGARITVTKKLNPASKTYTGTLKRTAPAFIDRPVVDNNGTPSPGDGEWHFQDCQGETGPPDPNTGGNFENFCDAIPISFDASLRNGHRTYFELSWFGSKSQMGSTLYLENGQDTITDLSGDATSADDNDDQRQRATIIDLPKGNYWLAVACKSTPCASEYKVLVRIQYEDLFTGPPQNPGPVITFSARPTGSATTATGGVSTTPAPSVLAPGADGPASSRSINGIAIGQQAKQPSNKSAVVTNVITGLLLAMILFGGGTFVALKIRRDLGR
jgi:hypothetical protein